MVKIRGIEFEYKHLFIYEKGGYRCYEIGEDLYVAEIDGAKQIIVKDEYGVFVVGELGKLMNRIAILSNVDLNNYSTNSKDYFND